MVTQGQRQLNADKLVIYQNEDSDITKIMAYGKPAHYNGQTPDKPEIIDAYAE